MKLLHGDCLEEMKKVEDKSIDMILCDLPYGTTACKWDTIIPFEPLWEQYERIIKDNGAIVLTASQPFTSALVMSNIKMFRYEWIWEKSMPVGYLDAKRKPLKCHENLCVFYKKLPTYNPQFWLSLPYNHKGRSKDAEQYRKVKKVAIKNNGERYPLSFIKIKNNERRLHPTQKPVALFEYLIKTYTNEGDLVLDNCAGSGTTGVACQNTGRDFILIEREEEYCKIAEARLKQHQDNLFN